MPELAKGIGVTDVHPMADFVNYNKRSIDLPPGCKDMMDVLQAQGEAQAGNLRVDVFSGKRSYSIDVKRHQQTSGPLSAIGAHVQKLYRSRGGLVALWIAPHDNRLRANLMKQEKIITASVRFKQDSKYEQMVRYFLSRQNLKAPPDSKPTAFKMPVDKTCYLMPLPADAAGVTELLAGLFREVGLKDEAEMRYNTTRFFT